MNLRLRDSATIATVVALSALPYAGRLSFESDDWAFAALAAAAPPGSFSHVFAALETQDHTLRPMQFASLAALYVVGRGSPVVDSLVTTLAFALVAIGFYLTLRRLGVARDHALAAALVAAVAPNAATNRFWAAVPANLCLLFAFASAHLGLAAVRATGRVRLAFATLAIAAEVACGLAYEIALPLFVLFAAAYVRRYRALAYATVVTACALIVAKASLETRGGYDLHALAPFVLRHTATFAYVQFVELGVALPGAALTATHVLDGPTIACAVAVAILCALALALPGDAPLPRGASRALVLGSLACACAYSLFAIDRSALWTATGLEDRKLAAFALGFSLVVVACCAGIARCVAPRIARATFASAVGAYAFGACLVVELVGASHVAAANVQRDELAFARADVRALPAGATLLLGGCTDVGPGVVFEAPWDTTAALRRDLEAADLRADVVSEKAVATSDAVVTHIYGARQRYAYGSRLFGYDPARRRTIALVDRSAGTAFVARTRRDDRDATCAGGDAGTGAPIFAPDRALVGAGPLDVARLRTALARRYVH